MKTVAAFVMKSSFLWLCVWCWAQTPQVSANLPKALTCDIGHYEPHRIEMWEFYTVAHYQDAPDVRKWISEHDSVDSAMKACKKVLKAQEKIWKQDLKGKKK
jgi:hypothetical protein